MSSFSSLNKSFSVFESAGFPARGSSRQSVVVDFWKTKMLLCNVTPVVLNLWPSSKIYAHAIENIMAGVFW